MKCKRCNGTRFQKRGRRNGRHRVQCKECGKWDSLYTEIGENANILLLDIEISPIIYPIWSLRQKSFTPAHIIRDWNVLSWAGWWLGRDEYTAAVLNPSEAKNGNDRRIVSILWKLLDTADVVITYNGNNFDLKRLTAKFMEHRLGRPSPYTSIDLYASIRRSASFTSHRLDFINRKLGIDAKTGHEGMPMWLKCIEGDKEALNNMLEYNVNDVVIMEELYNISRPWIYNHPSMTLMADDGDSQTCSVCLSKEILPAKTNYRTKVSEFPVYRCNDCGALMRGRKSVAKSRLTIV